MAILKDTTINGNLNVHGNIFEQNTLVDALTQNNFKSSYVSVADYSQGTGTFSFPDIALDNASINGFYILEFFGCQIFFVISNPILSQTYTISGVIAKADNNNYSSNVKCSNLSYTVIPGIVLAYGLTITVNAYNRTFIPNNTTAYLYRVRLY